MNNNTKTFNEQAIALRKQGLTQTDIAFKLSVTRDKVRYVLDKGGLKNYKYTKTCIGCGDDFICERHNAKYCSERCRSRVRVKTKTSKCRICKATVGFTKKLCEDCKGNIDQERKERRKETKRKQLLERMVRAIDPNRKKRCTNCKRIFYAHYKNKMYCSHKCGYKHRRVVTQYNRECIECGHHFTTNYLKTSCCSDECKRKRKNRTSEINRRHKLRENGRVDWDVSLNKLSVKDNNTCHLCGNKVKFNDYVMKDGHFIAGDSYPSIDHVLPVSKGGTHTWDNIRLAHRLCNSIKHNSETYSNGQFKLKI